MVTIVFHLFLILVDTAIDILIYMGVSRSRGLQDRPQNAIIVLAGIPTQKIHNFGQPPYCFFIILAQEQQLNGESRAALLRARGVIRKKAGQIMGMSTNDCTNCHYRRS